MIRGIVVGSSPNRIQDPRFYETGIVLAVNATVMDYRVASIAHWYLCWDTQFLAEDPLLRPLKDELREFIPQPKFLRRCPEAEAAFGHWPNVIWFEDANENATPGGLQLRCQSNICTTAADLLWKMGCEEVILTGIDMETNRRVDGVDWCQPQDRERIAASVNEFFRGYPIPVYKTYAGGPLALPTYHWDEGLCNVP